MDVYGAAIRRFDHLRRSPSLTGGPGGHKEWLHFAVHAAGLDALVNFSLVDEPVGGQRPGGHHDGPWAETARLTLLARDDRGWIGDVDTYAQDQVSATTGDIDMRLGANMVRYEDGAYSIRARARNRDLACDLRLKPACMPALAPNIPLESGPPIHWCVLPRSKATGTLRIDGRVYDLLDAPSYHDHNWGRWKWGDDFAWEWGFGLPDDPAEPWSMVFVRLTNRARSRTLAQGLFLWHDGVQRRTFREHDIEVWHEGYLRPDSVVKVPAVMGLLHPEKPTDVPRNLHFRAGVGSDALTGRFESHDVAQVVIPGERAYNVTVINEVSGRVSLSGQVGGERVELHGSAVFEFLGE
jgi:hypothetical protein